MSPSVRRLELKEHLNFGGTNGFYHQGFESGGSWGRLQKRVEVSNFIQKWCVKIFMVSHEDLPYVLGHNRQSDSTIKLVFDS